MTGLEITRRIIILHRAVVPKGPELMFAANLQVLRVIYADLEVSNRSAKVEH